MDENHPMLNRTWVAGDKIDNTLAEHLDADMLQTEQSFIQTYHSQQYRLPGEPPGAVRRSEGVKRRRLDVLEDFCGSWLKNSIKKWMMWLQKQMVKQKVISRPPEVWDILMCHRALLWFLGVGCNGGICDRQFWDDFTLFGFHLSNYKVFNTPPTPPSYTGRTPPWVWGVNCLMIFENGHPLKAMQLQPIGDDHFEVTTSKQQKETVEVQHLGFTRRSEEMVKDKFLKVHGLGKRIRSNDVEWVLLDIILLIFLRFETVCVCTFSGSRKQARLLGRHKANWLTYRSTIRGYLRNFACHHTCELLCNCNWQIM